MLYKEIKNKVIDQVKEEVGLEQGKDYVVTKIVQGKLGTYVVLGDLTEYHSTLMGVGLWVVKEDGSVYCVNIPFDLNLWDDYNSGELIKSGEEENAMKLFGD